MFLINYESIIDRFLKVLCNMPGVAFYLVAIQSRIGHSDCNGIPVCNSEKISACVSVCKCPDAETVRGVELALQKLAANLLKKLHKLSDLNVSRCHSAA